MAEQMLSQPYPVFDEGLPEAVQTRLEHIYTLINEHPDVFAMSLRAQGATALAQSKSLNEPMEIPDNEPVNLPSDPSSRVPDLIREYFRNRYDRFVGYDEMTESLLRVGLPKVHGSNDEERSAKKRLFIFSTYIGRVSIFNNERVPVQLNDKLPTAS